MNQAGFNIVQRLTGQMPRDPEPASELSAIRAEAGRKGGQKGGAARRDTLTPEQRSEIAKKAAAARWANKGEAKN